MEINNETNDSTLKLKVLTMGINKCNLVQTTFFSTMSSSSIECYVVLLEWRILKYVDFNSNRTPIIYLWVIKFESHY